MTASAQRRRWWALGALTIAVLTIGFDVTIMNVALPTMATELSAGTDGLQWIVNAYILLFAGLMLPIGAITSPPSLCSSSRANADGHCPSS